MDHQHRADVRNRSGHVRVLLAAGAGGVARRLAAVPRSQAPPEGDAPSLRPCANPGRRNALRGLREPDGRGRRACVRTGGANEPPAEGGHPPPVQGGDVRRPLPGHHLPHGRPVRGGGGGFGVGGRRHLRSSVGPVLRGPRGVLLPGQLVRAAAVRTLRDVRPHADGHRRVAQGARRPGDPSGSRRADSRDGPARAGPVGAHRGPRVRVPGRRGTGAARHRCGPGGRVARRHRG